MLVRTSLFIVMSFMLTSCSLWSGSKPTSDNKERDVAFAARKSMDAEPRKRILVLPFLDANTNRSKKVSEEARKTLVRNLARSDRFVLIHPSDLNKDPNAFVVNGEYDLENVSKAVEALGVTAVIEGKILDVNAKRLSDDVGLFRKSKARMDASIRMRMFSVRGNREILSQVRSANVEATTTRIGDGGGDTQSLQEDENLISEVITKAFQTTIPAVIQAVDKLSWEGKIALIQGNRIYLNAGRLTGLQVGDILKVSAQGDEIFDPESGDFIGLAPGRMKGTLEVVSYFGTDGAVAVIHSGSGFRDNDIVVIY